MDKTSLNRLCRHKLNWSTADDEEDRILNSVRADILTEVNDAYPYKFLIRKTEDTTLSAGDYEKSLVVDYRDMLIVALKDSQNIVYPVFPMKPWIYYGRKPDLDTQSQRPNEYFVYEDSQGKPKIEFRCKSDGSYTVIYWYKRKLREDDIAEIPNGLVLFYGIMSVLAPGAEMKTYKDLFETEKEKLWIANMPDFGDDPLLQQDPMLEVFNEYMASIS